MKKYFALLFILFLKLTFAQKVEVQILFQDKISIRALQIWDGKVWYTGTDSKFGYVSLKDSADKKQIKLSDEKLEFRTLAQNSKYFYTINILSPAFLFTINKKSLNFSVQKTDTTKTAFFDAFIFDKFDRGIAISDPNKSGSANPRIFFKSVSNLNEIVRPNFPKYFPGEAHFAASNTNIAMNGNKVWIATGGTHARIFKFSWNNPFKWEAFETPFIQGTASTGIYSIDFFDKKFGIAVGGDYIKQAENINNIATTNDGGKTWQIQASGKNGGYKTCVKFRPKSKGKDIIAVGDQNIEFSSDYGKTWKTISEEKGLYVCEWIDKNTVVLAGKNRIVKMILK
ncbi:MAG: WD40/YVTN/BNR-like repeat-containing protein [Kaistella sp.]